MAGVGVADDEVSEHTACGWSERSVTGGSSSSGGGSGARLPVGKAAAAAAGALASSSGLGGEADREGAAGRWPPARSLSWT